MANVAFTQNIQRHVACRAAKVAGGNVREVMDNLFASNPRARAYVLDDQAALRKHMAIYVDGQLIRDRVHLSDPVTETSDIYVFQALSGG
jgi:molybdopterin synthase sulfur carrier subunit